MIANIEESINVNGVFIDQKPAYNKMLNGEVALQLNKNVVAGQVKQRALIPEGKIVGKYDYNPMVNSMIYEVEFPDSQVKDYAENFIANNILSQVDYKGYSVTLVN